MRTCIKQDRGAAAVEFALVFPVIFLLLYGLISFGAILYTQLAVSRAVSDGARAAALLPIPLDEEVRDYELVRTQVIESLANSAIAPPASNASFALRRAWLESHVRARISIQEAECASTGGGTCATISLSFPYSDGDGTRLLPAINVPGIGGTESWLPDALVSAAIATL
jgi:Flp pilus assembly pilin Flp